MPGKQNDLGSLAEAPSDSLPVGESGNTGKKESALSSHVLSQDVESIPSHVNVDTKEHDSVHMDPSSHDGELAGDQPQSPQGNAESLEDNIIREDHSRFWYRLPKAAKASLILSFVGSILLIAYSITSVSLRNDDEEAHIATTIIIL